MHQSIGVLGTSTDIGKTLVSAVLCRYFAKPNCPSVYFKPVATGPYHERDALVVQNLVQHNVHIEPECYWYEPAVSPHWAAHQAKQHISRELILERYTHIQKQHPHQTLIVESAGGLLVPIDFEGNTMAHVFQDLQLPCVLVASSQLGTINHTLLTLEACAKRNIDIKGVILNGPPHDHNALSLERIFGVRILAHIERMPVMDEKHITQTAQALPQQLF